MTLRPGLRLFVFFLLAVCGVAHGQTQPRLMGTSTLGGGSIFSLNLDGSGFSNHKTFSPEGDQPTRLIDGGDGFLYGMTTYGGSGAVGVVYKIKPDGSQFSVIHNFQGADGSQPAGKLLKASDGLLYGMTEYGGLNDRGVVFRINVTGSGFQVLKSFDFSSNGAYPRGGLIEVSAGNLMGTTRVGGPGIGTLFSIKLDGSNFQNVHIFNSPGGNQPAGTLLQLSDGVYGMTTFGGPNDFGTIYKIQTDGTSYTILHNFDGTNGSLPTGDLILGLDNQLYGIAQNSSSSQTGVIFKMQRNGSNYTVLQNFNTPLDYGASKSTSLVQDANGILYGTALNQITDPNNNNGVLFKLNPDGSGFQFLINANSAAGDYPTGDLLIDSNGILYGMRKGLAEYPLWMDKNRSIKEPEINPSKIFSYNPSNSAYLELKAFARPDGNHLRGDFVLGNADLLFGTTYDGGLNNRGVLYSINTDGTGYQALYHFNDLTGGPVGQLYRSSGGDIYGTTAHGKILYRVHEDGNSFTTLHTFDDTPTGLAYFNGDFYGMTTGDGAGSFGYIFKIQQNGSNFLKLLNFNSTNGAYPGGTITVGSDGILYGMTMLGGSSNKGVVFSIAPDGSNYTLVMEFDGINGSLPTGDLLFGADLTLFGMSGGDNAGTFQSQIFNVYTNGTNFRRMQGIIGNAGQGNILQSPSGELYGTVHLGVGTTSNYGYVFQTNIEPSDFSSIHDLNGTNGVPLTSLKYLDVPIQNQTITFNPPAPVTFGDLPFDLTATSTSNLPVSYTSSDLTVATVSGSTVTIVGVGTSAITANQAGNGIFNPATGVAQTLIVNKGSQTITFNTLPQKYYGDAPFSVPATINSSLTMSFVSSNPAVATITGQTVTIVGIGSTDITASQAGNANLNAATPVMQTLSVNKGLQNINFGTLPVKNFGDAPFSLNATVNSGLAISYSSTDANVATIVGNTLTIRGGGSATIIASQAGNGFYDPAPDATQTLIVNKIGQTITFPPVAAKAMGEPPFLLTATTTSGLQANFSTLSDKITIAGILATIVKPGSITVKADQPGNANFTAAAQASQTFCINPAKPFIAVTGINTPAVTLTSNADTGNQWYRNGNVISGATSKVYVPVGNGNFTVNVTVEGCVSVISDPTPLIITGDIIRFPDENALLIYPNPAKDEVLVNLEAFAIGKSVDVVLYDISGKRLIQKTGTGGERMTLDIRSYGAGSYLVHAVQETLSQAARLVKE